MPWNLSVIGFSYDLFNDALGWRCTALDQNDKDHAKSDHPFFCDISVKYHHIWARQNGHHYFVDDILEGIFMNKDLCIIIQILLKYIR